MRNWTFDRKLRLFLVAAILTTSLVVLIASTWSAISSISQKSRSLMESQLYGASGDIDARLVRYRDMAIALMLDSGVKGYLRSASNGARAASPSPNNARIDEARSALSTFFEMDSQLQFIVLIRRWPEEYIFKGIYGGLFAPNYEQDLAHSIDMGYGDLRLSRTDTYAGGAETLTVIHSPVVAPLLPRSETGALCISVRDNLVSPSMTDPKLRFKTSLISTDSMLTLSTSTELGVNMRYKHFDRLQGDSGSFEADGALHVYRKVGRWAFYLVGEMPMSTLYGDSLSVATLLGALSMVFVALSLLWGTRMVKRMYSSLSQLSHGMDVVSHGDLSVRFSDKGVGEDFQRIYLGFNNMTGRISDLVEKVKSEERQMERIRFNALQAQIHPHFLYNTLECIRWMAAANGSQDIVRIVKALSQYYRICLSRGDDVITLAAEVAFTGHYLTIQSIRYENRIHCVFDIPESIMDVKIPKITLQPLVENYVNHAFDATDEDGLLRIAGREEEQCVVIDVMDNGRGMSKEKIAEMNASLDEQAVGIGYGIRNVHQRIRILFGEPYGLSYSLGELGGVTAHIRLPRRGGHV